MNQKTRLIVLLCCIGLFLIITPLIIFYSLGYRYDFETRKIVATGGIYIKASPLGTDVIIDSDTDKKTSLFSTYVFVQNLLPKPHTVLIKKDGYFDYQKTLGVKENEVTKLENVTLFKKEIVFSARSGSAPGGEKLPDPTQSPFDEKPTPEKYILKNNNLYTPKILTPVIKNVIAYYADDSIIWLAQDGYLYQSDLNGENTQKLNQTNIKITKQNTYALLVFSNNIFLKQNSDILLFDANTKDFTSFALNIGGIKPSLDGQKIAYWQNNKVWIYYLNYNKKDSYPHEEKISLNTFAQKIADAIWLNDDYIIFSLEKNIVISEIDARNNVNIITLPLPDSLKITPTTKILFNQQDKKLYIQNGKETFVSEKLVP